MLYKTLGKIKLDAEDLIAYSTSKFTVERKIKYFNKAREAKEKSLNGSVTVTRCTPNNKDIDSFVFTKTATVFKDEPGFYNYEKDQSNSERYVWWMNFAGNPELMYFLQICAAGITGVDELVLHSVDDDTFLDAKEMYEDLDDENSLDSIINMLFEKEYYWGSGDGN